MRILSRFLTFLPLCLSACAGTPLTPQPQVTHAPPDAARTVVTPTVASLDKQPDTTPSATSPGRLPIDTHQWIFTAAWNAVRDKDFDKAVVDERWDGLRAMYEPLAMAAPDEPTFYHLVNEMLAGLGQSHLHLFGPGEMPKERGPEQESRLPRSAEVVALGTGIGDPGIVVRDIEGT